MRDFQIPTFEQFQYLRELRKAERRKQQAAETTVASLKDHHHHRQTTAGPLGTLAAVPSSSQPVSPNQDNNSCEINVDDDGGDDSATELGTPPAKRNLSVDSDDDDDSANDFVFTKKRRKQPSEESSHRPNQHPPKQQPKTNTPTFVASKQPNSDNILDNTMSIMSPHSVGTVSPLQEPSPDHHDGEQHQQSRRQKPWFQRKRKPKLQQMRLSF
jgi:hypothetical protein